MVSDFEKMIGDLLRKAVDEEFTKAVIEDMRPRPGWKGFTGLLPIMDEHLFIHQEFNPSWTPAQFEKMWDSFSYQAKVRYVRSLLTENRMAEYSSADANLSTLLYR